MTSIVLPRRRILWTGGMDSTWLVLDALLHGDRVEAIAWRSNGSDPDYWQKPANEDAAKRRIVAALPRSMQRRVAVVAVTGEHANREWWRVYDRLRDADPDGAGAAQQDWLVGAIPSVVGPGLETGYVAGDGVVREPWRREVLEGLGLEFPLIEHTKAGMLADAQRRGFADLLAMTWSCERSGASAVKPCAECLPCRLRILPQQGFAQAG